MTEPQPLRFNALTDPWLPLLQADGSTVWASFVEVLAGEKDGYDLDYPRDDFRVFGRLLLSALTQALFAAKTKAELVGHLSAPLERSAIERRIAPVIADFELFGSRPFLQLVAPAKIPSGGAASFVFPAADLFISPIPVDVLCLPIALVALFIEHTFAGGAGRGYVAGPAGQPGALTLLDVGSIRSCAWANTLTLDTVAQRYAKEDKVPWSNEKRADTTRDVVGLVTGLFFQPRGIFLIPAGDGICSVSGVPGALVRFSPLLSKSTLSKKASGTDDLWQHPNAPLAVNSQGIGAIRLSATQPAWTDLAQLLDPLAKKKTTKKHPNEGPAPVLQQWKSLSWRQARVAPRLLVLDFERDKANVKQRFFEAYPLTELLLNKHELVELLRALVDEAQRVERRLRKALVSAHDGQRRGGFALREAEAAFWRDSEPEFHRWLASTVAIEEWTDETAEQARMGSAAMIAAARRSALAIFDAHVEVSEFDPAKAARIAIARRALRADLRPSTSSTNSSSTSAEGALQDYAST